MRVLGLDPSLTNYGWAIISPDGLESRGRFRTKVHEYDYFVDRYTDLQTTLQELVESQRPDCVGLEHPVYGAQYSEGMFALYVLTLQVLREAKLDTVVFSPSQLKSFAREIMDLPKSWDMKKPDMVGAARTASGLKGKWDHNEADAYLIARTSLRFWQFLHKQITDLTPVETKAFTEVHTYVRGKNAGKTVEKGIMYREDDRYYLWSKSESWQNQRSQNHLTQTASSLSQPQPSQKRSRAKTGKPT